MESRSVSPEFVLCCGCRSVLLPSTGLPSAGELVATALKVLKRSPNVMPCNRVAVSTNVFIPIVTKSGSLTSMFSLKEKRLPSKTSEDRSLLPLPCGAKRARSVDSIMGASTVQSPSVPCEKFPAVSLHAVKEAMATKAVAVEPHAGKLAGKRTLLQLSNRSAADPDCGDWGNAQATSSAEHNMCCACQSWPDRECPLRVARARGISNSLGRVPPCEDVGAGEHSSDARWGRPQHRSAWSGCTTGTPPEGVWACHTGKGPQVVDVAVSCDVPVHRIRGLWTLQALRSIMKHVAWLGMHTQGVLQDG